MNAFTPDWKVLKDLRELFINESFSRKTYWLNLDTLAQYDATFAERIGWKWDAVLADLQRKINLENLGSFTLVDWGCGTAIASRKFLSFFGTHNLSELVLWDQSSLVVNFAKEKVQSEFPGIDSRVKTGTSLFPHPTSPYVLLISHVLNELSKESLQELMDLVLKAEWVIWVEPGTPKVSAQLIQVREELRSKFQIVAPCPHQKVCGLFQESNTSDWCHFFAPPPNHIFREAFWKEFSQRLGIDLRSLPTSFLVLAKTKQQNRPDNLVLGRPRHYKGYSLALLCSEKGVQEKKHLSRNDAHLIDLMKEHKFLTLLP